MADEDFRITQVETKHILLGWHVIIHSTDGIRKEWHPTKRGAEKGCPPVPVHRIGDRPARIVRQPPLAAIPKLSGVVAFLYPEGNTMPTLEQMKLWNDMVELYARMLELAEKMGVKEV